MLNGILYFLFGPEAKTALLVALIVLGCVTQYQIKQIREQRDQCIKMLKE